MVHGLTEKKYERLFMLKMTNILEQDQREVPSFFCEILEGPTTCPCPAQTVQRGNREMLLVLLKVTGREKKVH